MSDKNPKMLDALYFRNQRNEGGPIPRTSSVNLSNSGQRIMGMDPVAQSDHRSGKRINQMVSNGSSSNILFGNYGSDPLSNIDRNFKPYSKSAVREVAAY